MVYRQYSITTCVAKKVNTNTGNELNKTHKSVLNNKLKKINLKWNYLGLSGKLFFLKQQMHLGPYNDYYKNIHRTPEVILFHNGFVGS